MTKRSWVDGVASLVIAHSKMPWRRWLWRRTVNRQTARFDEVVKGGAKGRLKRETPAQTTELHPTRAPRCYARGDHPPTAQHCRSLLFRRGMFDSCRTSLRAIWRFECDRVFADTGNRFGTLASVSEDGVLAAIDPLPISNPGVFQSAVDTSNRPSPCTTSIRPDLYVAQRHKHLPQRHKVPLCRC